MKLPYFRWHPKDAETDENFRCMNDSEIGFYVRCLNHAWLNEGLPVDPEERARALHERRSYADRQWIRVGKCFTEKGGRYVNPRQEEERSEIARKHSERSENGRIGNKKRWEKSSPSDRSAIARAFASGSGSSESSSGVVKNSPREKDFDFADWFERQYGRHPKKRDRTLAEHAAVEAYQLGELDPPIFETAHKAWCASEEWQWKGGAKAPTLAQWIGDRSYRYSPPTESPPSGDYFEGHMNPGLRD